MLQVHRHEAILSASPIVVFDGNLNVLAMEAVLQQCRRHNIPGEIRYKSSLFSIFYRYNTKADAVSAKGTIANVLLKLCKRDSPFFCFVKFLSAPRSCRVKI